MGMKQLKWGGCSSVCFFLLLKNIFVSKILILVELRQELLSIFYISGSKV